jgi:hypothetical protein
MRPLMMAQTQVTGEASSGVSTFTRLMNIRMSFLIT